MPTSVYLICTQNRQNRAYGTDTLIETGLAKNQFSYWLSQGPAYAQFSTRNRLPYLDSIKLRELFFGKLRMCKTCSE